MKMSFLTALKGFGAWVAREWAKMATEAPKIEKIADAVLSYAAPALQIVLGALDPPAAAIVAPIIAEIQKDLHVASGLIYDFGATPSAAGILASVEQDLQGLLTAGHIKDPNLQAKVTMIVNTVGSLATAIAAALKPPTQ
jgi:hypothetical protein